MAPWSKTGSKHVLLHYFQLVKGCFFFGFIMYNPNPYNQNYLLFSFLRGLKIIPE